MKAGTRLLRTTAARLTLTYTAVFAASVLVLFAIVVWSASGFMQRQIDQTVGNEIDEIRADMRAPGSGGGRAVVSGLALHSPGLGYLLQAPSGRVLAGNLPAMAARLGDRVITGRHGRIRGRGMFLADGSFLFVGMSDFEETEMREAIARAFGVGCLAVLVLSAAGGLVVSLSVLRRVEAISRTSREIMGGDLGRRVARDGSGDEFDHLAASLNAMLERIATLMAGLRRMSGDIAHDLRTPLSRLRGRLERARAGVMTQAALRQALDEAIADADGILATFGALLRIVQIESGSRRSGFGPVALSKLLEELAEAYGPVAEAAGQSIASAIEDGLAVVGDRELLTQLFVNLIENAVRHTPPATHILLAARGRRDGVEVVVADDGPGVPQDMRERVLAPFFRLEASRTTPGNGLGLGLASAIAALHEAALVLEDARPGLRCLVVLAGAAGA